MNSRFLKSIALLFATVTLMACNCEDDMSALEGQPLVLYADMPMTRSTVDNQWNVGDEVAVKIGDEIKKYYIKDTETGELVASSGTKPFRWSSSFDEVEVTAWSVGGFCEAEPLTGITIPDDQSGGYDRYDLLYAKGTLKPSNTHLTFYHQMAKVVVQLKIINTEFIGDRPEIYLGSDYDATGAPLNIVPLTADFNAPMGNINLGSWNNYRNFPENGGVTMKHENETSVEDGYYAAFSALLIPNDYSNTRFLSVDLISDLGIFYYVPAAGEANLQSGHTYTYRITVYDDFLDVVVDTDDGDTNSVTPWSPNN